MLAHAGMVVQAGMCMPLRQAIVLHTACGAVLGESSCAELMHVVMKGSLDSNSEGATRDIG